MTIPGKTEFAANDTSLDEMLGDLPLRILKVSPRNIDREIHRAITEIGEHSRVDSVQLRIFTKDRSAVSVLHRLAVMDRQSDTSLSTSSSL